MTINFTKTKPTRFSMHDATVTYKGDEYQFWAEYDVLNDSFVAEFNDDEPQGDFDFTAWSDDVEKHLSKVVADYAS